MVINRHIRAGKEFLALREHLREELVPITGKISDPQLTNEIAYFLRNENLDKWMVRRAKQQSKRRLFS